MIRICQNEFLSMVTATKTTTRGFSTTVTMRRTNYLVSVRQPPGLNSSTARFTTKQCFRQQKSSRRMLHSNMQFQSFALKKPVTRTATSAWAIMMGVGGIAGIGCRFWMIHQPTAMTTTQCEAMVDTSSDESESTNEILIVTNNNDKNQQILYSKIKRGLRMIRRLLKLIIVFSPVVIFYPFHWLMWQTYLLKEKVQNNDTDLDAQEIVLESLDTDGDIPNVLGWYYKLCLFCVECSGAACIKIMQWAGSRPDMFGHEFCAVFSHLQDDTTPHRYKHTQQTMKEAYGNDWQQHIELNEILGSGCIAQVYKGVVKNDKDGTKKSVAVKVMHPNVEDDIDADLDLLRFTARTLEWFNMQQLKWLNLPGCIEEMADMLKIQLDLRTESEHLIVFNKNFAKNKYVKFPELIEGYPPTKHVMMETYCDGVPIMDFIRDNKADKALLRKMCEAAVKAVCQMIFLDNFTHGDLHPGNVLVSDDYKFILLDVGIVTRHSESDHKLISDVLAAFIRCDGRKAGRLMIDDSNTRLAVAGDHSVDEEEFIEKIENITRIASGKGYLMEKLGTYIAQICNAASRHHVMLNQAFISSALAVKVQEGIALALDPSIEIWKIAIPIILEGERRHGRAGERAKELLGFEQIMDWITGGKISERKAMKERKQKTAETATESHEDEELSAAADVVHSK